MASTLDVVNECLGTLGETPIAALTEYHEFKSSVLRILNKENTSLQAPGWWFNTEAIELVPNPSNEIVLPTDCLKWTSGVRTKDTLIRGVAKPWIVKRGSRLYDTRTQSYTLTGSVVGEIIRLLPFEDLPIVVNDYVAASTVLKFQSSYDSDNGKRNELSSTFATARTAARAEDIRQRAANLVLSNTRLSRIKRVTQILR